MKIVINTCYGGFGLSPRAVARMAELQGRPCYFFKSDLNGTYEPRASEAAAADEFIWHAFDIPDPSVLSSKPWHKMTLEEKQTHNTLYAKHSIENRPDNRTDALLVQVVEELGDAAAGKYAKLKVVEVPDGTDWYIEEHDGNEWIAERHETWR